MNIEKWNEQLMDGELAHGTRNSYYMVQIFQIFQLNLQKSIFLINWSNMIQTVLFFRCKFWTQFNEINLYKYNFLNGYTISWMV